MLIACDLDRTLIPNGPHPGGDMHDQFFQFIKEHGHILVYVSGRNLALFHEAQRDYHLMTPNYFVGDVGTTIYTQNVHGTLVSEKEWERHIQQETPGWNWNALQQAIPEDEALSLQEKWRQNPFKLSYYLKALNKAEMYVREIESVVRDRAVAARVVYSVDPLKNLGLIDILPTAATKIAALVFLQKKLGVTDDDVVYCGDSGNDILPLTHGFKAIVVNNAEQEVKDEVARIAEEKGSTDRLYIASGKYGFSGNYASGILEGLKYFGLLE